MEQPVLRKRRIISPIWFLPLLALCIGGWLLYTSYRDAGIDITIHFQTAEGITAGKTKVIYKGIPVGTVTDVAVDQKLDGVIVHVEMEKETKHGLVDDTVFWIVKPVISAGRISGLDTLLSGSYITVRKGNSTTARRVYKGLANPPPLTSDIPGLHLTLETDTLYSLQRGSNIYSKNLQIGMVDDYRLADNGKITVDVFIKPEFSHLIREGTRFWNSSGLSVTGDLQSGLSVNVESMAALIYGGLACATPKSLQDSPQAVDGRAYHLYKDFEDAQYGIPMTLQLASGDGIVAGKTKIMFRGLKAGVVRTLNINDDKFHTVTANILLDPRAKEILHENTRFWVVRPQVSIEGIKNINTLISGSYITFQVGDGEYQDHFIVDSSPMPKPFLRPGKRFSLLSENSGSLSIGTPVLYKKREVGEITDIRFTEDGKGIQTEILIYDLYTHLVREDAVFWDVSGVQVDGSLSSFNINLGSLQSMLAGGIAFSNPVSERTDKPKPQADQKTVFKLYSSWTDAVQKVVAMRRPGTVIKLQMDTMSPISKGAPVLYNKIPVGEVLEFKLAGKTHRIEGTILIYEKFTNLINTTTRFYNASGVTLDASLQGLSLKAESIDSIVAGGIAFFTPGSGKPLKNGQAFPLYKNKEDALNADSLLLTLQFSSGTGISKHTTIRYQGIVIGRLSKVWFDAEKEQVFATAAVQKKTAKLFRSESDLWLVKPQVDLSGIKHLDTVISGAYIDLRPGQGKLSTDFVVQDTSPSVLGPYPGLNLVLESPRLGSLKIGRPIYYRQIKIGQVTGVELGPTAQNVWIHININPEHSPLVHRGSRFWNASGVSVSAGLFSGVSVETESMETLVAGGVAMATPEGKDMGTPAQDGDHFILADKPEEKWLEWAPEIKPAQPLEAIENQKETTL
ncbi:MAG: MlaD family protein [Thermodesulfobacteriota bacterium]|nr:MlaD family protein [Thermodesulfobacteriota bacterium]